MSDEDVGDNEAEDMEMDGVPEDLDAKIANVREQVVYNVTEFCIFTLPQGARNA